MISKNMREIEMFMSRANIEAAIMQWISSMGGIKHGNETIEKISFDTKVLKGTSDILPIVITVSHEEEDVLERAVKGYGKNRQKL